MDKLIWLCSDWHFSHNKDFLLNPRGFDNSDEMNEEIVKRHNELVAPDDIVYCLGDVMLGGDFEKSAEYVKRMNGIKYLAIGNHDTDNKIKMYKEQNLFEDIQFGYRLRYKKKSIVLTHYPTLVENFDSAVKIVNIHGHTHNVASWNPDLPFCYNVCMEATNCKPILLDNILEEFKLCWHWMEEYNS